MTHHDKHWTRTLKLRTELEAIESQAGVRDKIAAFVEYNGPSDFRRVYFGVHDKSLRKALIAKFREQDEHGKNYLPSEIADAKEEIEAIRRGGAIFPWKIPSLLACVAVWLGYSIWAMPGALAGAVVGLFLGQAEVSRHKYNYAETVRSAEQALSELEKELQRDRAWNSETFHATEEESGSEDEGGDQPIHWAARIGDIEEIKELLASGAKVDAVNDYGSQPIHRAAANGNSEAVKVLLASGANVHAANTLHGWQPIHSAANKGHAEVIKVLLEAGSEIDRDDQYGFQPIHRAAENGNADAVKVLLAAGAKVDAVEKSYGSQPIHLASEEGNSEAVNVLLAAGARVDAVNNHDVQPIHYASNNNHAEVIKVLLAAGAKQPAPS